ncbi:hypothetical protein V8F06_000036 [Rhypophila decipiens]
MPSISLPELPVRHADLVKHITKHPETPLAELIKPYREYEATLRQAYAQNPDAEMLKDSNINVLPLFTDDTVNIKIWARDLENESKTEKERYIMPLPKNVRRANNSPAVVPSFKEFQRNFNVFSESSLVELNWDNVVAAGSSVVNCLLPVPEEHNRTKRSLREFYHEKFCPASDVDLFLYGLTEEQALDKIKEIETSVRDAILTETTTVRTKHAITICSQYPTRHIQIVLRIYKSVSEIMTGFDIDCSGAAFDGKQVYCTPRALESYMTQINRIDLSRRSPSYENRLSKYSHRGFEVYWPDLDRTRIDPTIFERSFQRTLGLARLLVLERLPTKSARDEYLDKRREERGRPRISRQYRRFGLHGDIKEYHEDEIADWVDSEEVSNYHTFTIPYGEKFHAKKIEKLCYTRDLLLNSEWNQPDDRTVYLHRHPAFFGRVEDVITDCCGYCPTPETEEEKEMAEEEGKIYVSGKLSFIKDDPGRQQIGSFNPLTEDDWTEMAYVGNTTRLCQAIVDCDAEHVEDWLTQEGADPNCRDYTGRTPLHLAVMSSTPQIVKLLVDAGARLISRLADGRTALHLAAARGNIEMVKILMDKSTANEAEFEDKKDQRRLAKNGGTDTDVEMDDARDGEEKDEEEESDMEMIDGESDEDEDGHSMATGSFVKVGPRKEDPKQDDIPDDDEEEPDFYDVNIISWDTPCSALHLAIMEGHEEIVKTLCQDYGADILLPVKFLDESKQPHAALLTLVLALALPVEKAKSMVKVILSLGATCAQADMNGVTPFHKYVEKNVPSLLQVLLEEDATGAKAAVNHTAFSKWGMSKTPLQVAIEEGNLEMVLKLIENGASTVIEFESWLKDAKQSVIQSRLNSLDENQRQFGGSVEQPLIMAIRSQIPQVALELLERGADPNTLTGATIVNLLNRHSGRWTGRTALDVVQKQLQGLRNYKGERHYLQKSHLGDGIDTYLDKFKEGTWSHFVVSNEITFRRKDHCRQQKNYAKAKEEHEKRPGASEKRAAIKEAIATLEKLEEALKAKGGKTYQQLYPERGDDGNWKEQDRSYRWDYYSNPPKSGPFEYDFNFHEVNDVTEARKAAYIELFEAAWDGDIEKIKKLTLTSWDAAQAEPPLKIAVRDQHHHSPFGLAFVRGHFDVAKAVLEIAQAQYSPREKVKARFRMAGEETSEYSDDDGDSQASDDSEPNIVKEVINDQFTIENVGQVSMQVTSHTKPLDFLQWDIRPLDAHASVAPFTYAVRQKDMEALKFLLDLGEHFTAQKIDPLEEATGYFVVPTPAFTEAISLGKVDMLVEIIKRGGAGLPLEDMVTDSGIEMKEKPRSYQGLTVYGKKRKDWATAGRGVMQKPTGLKTSPLLLAAEYGSLESVEWFLTDIPLRHYLEFSRSKGARDDARLKHLAQAPGGFDGAISKWLKDQNDLVLHIAVMRPATERNTKLVSFLVKSYPQLVNTRAGVGATPLLIACRLGRCEYVKILLEAGADQTIRDYSWNNLLHSALKFNPTAAKLKSLLTLLDARLVVSMITERNNLGQDGRTPLHAWIQGLLSNQWNPTRYKDEKVLIEVLRFLVDLSPEAGKRALWMVDGTGDTPLHTLVSEDGYFSEKVVEAVLDMDPDLLFRENAVGRTPFEVAHDRFFADKCKTPGPGSWHRGNDSSPTLVSAGIETFVKKSTDALGELEDNSRVALIWKLCSEYAKKASSTKRRLVSLHEANDVAKRLGEVHMDARYKFQLSKEKATSTASDRDSNTGGDEKRNVLAEKRSRGGSDYVTERYDYNYEAWDASKDKKTEDDKEQEGSRVCSGCGIVHD